MSNIIRKREREKLVITQPISALRSRSWYWLLGNVDQGRIIRSRNYINGLCWVKLFTEGTKKVVCGLVSMLIISSCIKNLLILFFFDPFLLIFSFSDWPSSLSATKRTYFVKYTTFSVLISTHLSTVSSPLVFYFLLTPKNMFRLESKPAA